ncbi:MAG: type II toxin-antitoxin system HicB family antitoxin [Treponema sp.]|nr:type II toxin-antitoxin system HicB family antitoxin [Treponema sp.]
MELNYTYFKSESGMYVGYFDDFPQYVTQGYTFDELKEMLLDVYQCMELSKYHRDKLAV